MALEIDDRLVESALLLAVGREAGADFWRERERCYDISERRARERAFGELHRRRFEALGLGAAIVEALEEFPVIAGSLGVCRVAPAASRKEEGAELFVRRGDGLDARSSRTAVLRLRPESLLDRGGLASFLRRELFHLADMLDPAFGYESALPDVEGGAQRRRQVLERYAVLWDTVIDGRLERRGRAPEGARALRRRAFAAAFACLGPVWESEFERWFETAAPAHAALVRYALDPLAAAGVAAPRPQGACPLCRFPTVELSLPGVESSAPLLAAIRRDFPAWSPAQGICRQCADLYRSRAG
jgi:hypothetical protein